MTDWIEWKYTPEKTYPESLDTLVHVKFRDDVTVKRGMKVNYWRGMGADDSNWKQGTDTPDDEIIEYKVIKS